MHEEETIIEHQPFHGKKPEEKQRTMTDEKTTSRKFLTPFAQIPVVHSMKNNDIGSASTTL